MKYLIDLKKSQKLLLFIFPIFYLIIGTYFRTLLGDLSLRSIDPDYVYFSNGIGVALGSFDTGNIFHPGSPLQYFVALIFRITYLLRSPETTFLEDIFINPDLYLSTVSMSITGLITLLLFVAGLFVFRMTNSILYGVLIQTTTFLPIIWFDLIGRVTPEVFQAFPVILFSLIIIKYYWENKQNFSFNDIFWLALIFAFGLSTKVTFIPFVIIPLFIIDKWKKKVLFLSLTFFLFLLISMSVLLKIEYFWNWIKNIFIHSGDYGTGKSNIIDFELLKSNFNYFVNLESFYFKVVLFSFFTLLAYLIIQRKTVERRIVIFTSATILSIAIHLILVCKHFAHRNFIPSLLLLPLLVFFTIEILKKFGYNKIYNGIVQVILIAFLLITIENQFNWLPVKSNALGTEYGARKETFYFASTLDKNSIKIIASQSYGSPFKEYAIMYSTVWSERHLQEKYKSILNEIYPGNYQFFTFDSTMKYWGDKFNAKTIIESGKKVYLYLDRNDEEVYSRTINKLIEENGAPFEVEREMIYLNDYTTEIIYNLLITEQESAKGSGI
jgi:hypothetical protein